MLLTVGKDDQILVRIMLTHCSRVKNVYLSFSSAWLFFVLPFICVFFFIVLQFYSGFTSTLSIPDSVDLFFGVRSVVLHVSRLFEEIVQ